jgi:hypothetical protein
MTDPALLSALADAIRNAGATEEIIAALLQAGGAFEQAPRPKGGRPRKYADRAWRDRAYRERKKARDETSADDRAHDETYDEIDRADHRAAHGGDETRYDPPQVPGDQIPYRLAIEHLHGRLLDAAHGNFDLSANIEPIRTLLDQGCDLEADILPIVAREVPELPRPLKNWGALWLVREILAARDQRLAGQPVEAPPPAQRTPAIEWDEFVGGLPRGPHQMEHGAARPQAGRPGMSRTGRGVEGTRVLAAQRAGSSGTVRATVRHHIRFEVAALVEEGADRLDAGREVEIAVSRIKEAGLDVLDRAETGPVRQTKQGPAPRVGRNFIAGFIAFSPAIGPIA